MPLGIAELAELEDAVLRDLPDRITNVLTTANRTGRLEDLLELLNMTYLLSPAETLKTYRDGKIIVIGYTEVKEETLKAIAKSLNIDKDRFEFCLDYEKAQKYEYRKLQYASSYRVVLFGPIPHSTTGTGNSNSVIAEMEKRRDCYPRVVRLGINQELKITNSSFKKALAELKEENYI